MSSARYKRIMILVIQIWTYTVSYSSLRSERVAVATEPALLEAVDSRALGAPVGRSSVHPRLHERYAPEQPGARAPHLNSCRATR